MTMTFYGLSGIYQIRNKVNDKRYIGSSVSVYNRFCRHKTLLRKNEHFNSHLQNAWNKHGEENFDFQYRLLCPKDDLIKYEQAFLDSARHEYNIATDATAPMLGLSWSEEQRKKFTKARTGYKHTKETRHNMSVAAMGEKNNNYGKKASKETRQKMSEAHKGQVPWCTGKHLSDEHKRKLSIANKSAMTEEVRQKISNSMKGIRRSEETRRKMSKAQIARRAIQREV